MTREEAIGILNETQVVYFAPNGKKKVQEALDMAIEALSSYDELYKKAKEVNDMANEILNDFPSYKEALTEPKTIIGIDIPYGSDKGLATVFKCKNDKLILEEVKEIMSVVRCKDCRYWTSYGNCTRWTDDTHDQAYTNANDFCSYREKKDK